MESIIETSPLIQSFIQVMIPIGYGLLAIALFAYSFALFLFSKELDFQAKQVNRLWDLMGTHLRKDHQKKVSDLYSSEGTV